MNFLADETIYDSLLTRLVGTDPGGPMRLNRLLQNLLSSQPLCFNLFGFLQHHRPALASALSSVLPIPVTEVITVKIEWKLPRTPEHKSGSAFDALITFNGPAGQGFLGVETKYSEDLKKQPESDDPEYYNRLTRERTDVFKQGAETRLRMPITRQLWYNLILALRVLEEEDFSHGGLLLLSCRDDPQCQSACNAVCDELMPGSEGLVLHASYESLLAALPNEGELGPWKEHFSERYLSFPPHDAGQAVANDT